MRGKPLIRPYTMATAEPVDEQDLCPTYAELLADVLPYVGKPRYVTDDPDPERNGRYLCRSKEPLVWEFEPGSKTGAAVTPTPGPQGPQGPTGSRGAQGNPGEKGEPGAPGATGARGPQGEPGVKGDPGTAGAAGSRGAQGPQGTQGPAGGTGPTGNTGAKGEPGTPGAAGAAGLTGAVGPPGAAGAKGDTGALGPAGPAGAKGDTGAKGDKGDTGPAGEKGLKGDAGATGQPGAAAAKGDPGVTGPRGATGANGPAGAPGVQGPIGPAGPKGSIGEPGPAGPTGATGPAGATSAVGATGPAGAQGLPGPQGTQGEPGAPGPTGPEGSSAYQVAVNNGFVGTQAEWLVSLAPKKLGDESVTNAMLATDIKVGSLSAAANAYPTADRAGLTTVERFLVWLGGKMGGLVTDLSNLAGRVKTLEDRPVSTGGGSTAPAYTLPQASATQLGGVKGAGTGLTGNVVVNPDGSLSAPATTGGTGLPAGGTAGQVLTKSSDADGAAGWATLTAADAAAQLKLVDKLNIAANQFGTHPAFATAYGKPAGADNIFEFLLKSLVAVASTQAVKAPAAPGNVQVDDAADTMAGDLVAGFPSIGDYEAYGVSAFPGIVAFPQAGDLQGSRLVLRGLTGPHDVGSVGIRVAASGNRPAGAWAVNNRAFTGSAVVVTPPTVTTYTGNYTPTANDIAAACGSAGGQGQLATRTSTENQNAADTAARNAALASITCNVVTAPASYDNAVTGGNTYKGVTLGAEASDQLEFNNASGVDNSPATMELWLNGSQVGAVPYENYYAGKPFRYTHAGQKYTKNFTAGRIDL